MSTISKTKPSQTPWDKLGITYQQYYYRKKAGTLQDPKMSPRPSSPTSGSNAMRDSVLVTEFLERFEAKQDTPSFSGMEISGGMAQAIYNTLRTDGH